MTKTSPSKPLPATQTNNYMRRGMPRNWHAKAASFSNEAAWHRLRRRHIGGTEQPALWNASPYMTAFRVYHVKKGWLQDDFEENERMVIGKHVEPAIARAALQLHQREGEVWSGGYLKHPTVKGMGATLDWIILEPGVGYVPLEIKNVAGSEWMMKWSLGEGAFEPPLHIDLQVQHQIAVSGAPFAYIAVLVGGSKIELLKRPAIPDVQEIMKQKVKKFWTDFDANIEPEVIADRDYEALARVRVNVRPGETDMRGNERIEGLIQRYKALKATEAEAKKASDGIRTEMLLAAGEATEIATNAGRVTAKLVPPREARLVEYAAQPARREIRIYPKKEKGQDSVADTDG